MGELAGKIDRAKELIAMALRGAARPCVLWSGGKDSTCLLHLARAVRPEIECVFWTLPWERGKLKFARYLEAEWGLTVHDAPPAGIALCRGNGRIDVMETYPLRGRGQVLTVARGTEPMEAGKVFTCGVEWLERPKAVAGFPFDLALHGHKSVDVDPLSGPVPLQADVVPCPGGTEVVFPLRDWSDADVWNYTWGYDIPYDPQRYKTNGEALKEKRGNSDYYHACFACCDASAGEFVACPKRGGAVVASVAGRVPWVAPKVEYCRLRTEEKGE